MNKHSIRALYITDRWYLLMAGAAVLFFLSFFFNVLFSVAVVYFMALAFCSVADYFMLFAGKGDIYGHRILSPRFSLGDENPIHISIINKYRFRINILLIDELPAQLQMRDFSLKLGIKPASREKKNYTLRPITRGEYEFGNLWAFITTPLQLLRRRKSIAGPATVKVYPSFYQLKKYRLLALSDNVTIGSKKTRRVGHSMEFEKIKTYVTGDDMRTINWKATARNKELMVNTYTDTRQQQIYCVIDKGRSMKLPFEGMTLLDYSINTALALLNVVMLKQDRAGLITFSNKVNDIVPAERRSNQLYHILEALYRQQTAFMESSYEHLLSFVHRRISQRSCILLFTNFETLSSLERQLPYLRKLASRHLVCVIFFQNTLLKQIHDSQPDSTEGIYIKTIADRFDYEKKQIVKELRKHGMIAILTTPHQLTTDTINKYLELKAKQMA